MGDKNSKPQKDSKKNEDSSPSSSIKKKKSGNNVRAKLLARKKARERKEQGLGSEDEDEDEDEEYEPSYQVEEDDDDQNNDSDSNVKRTKHSRKNTMTGQLRNVQRGNFVNKMKYMLNNEESYSGNTLKKEKDDIIAAKSAFKKRMAFWNDFKQIVGNEEKKHNAHSSSDDDSDTDDQREVIVSKTTKEEDAKNEQRRIFQRKKVVEEIFNSEKLYLKFLTLLLYKFVIPLKGLANSKKNGINIDIDNLLFSIQSIVQLHEEIVENFDKTKDVPGTLTKICDYLKIYKPYVNSYERILKQMSDLQKNKVFKKFIEEKRQDSEVGGLDIMSYLIMPIQRIPRYRLLLRELISKTLPTNKDMPKLQKALESIKGIADEVNESKRQAENGSIVLSIQNKLTGTPAKFESIYAPHRLLLNEGTLVSKKNRKIRFWLFNDRLLYTTMNYKFRGFMVLRKCKIEATDIGFKITDANLPKKPLLIKMEDATNKQKWIDIIDGEIKKRKQERQQERKRKHGRRNKVHSKLANSLKKLNTLQKNQLKNGIEDEEEAQKAVKK